MSPDEMPASDEQLEADVDRYKRQRDALGAVNLRAEEDARGVQNEHDTLVSRKAGSGRRGEDPALTAFPASTARAASGC